MTGSKEDFDANVFIEIAKGNFDALKDVMDTARAAVLPSEEKIAPDRRPEPGTN